MRAVKKNIQCVNCPSCGTKDALKNQTFCAECGYYHSTSSRVDNAEEISRVKEPSVIGSIVVAVGVLIIGIAGLLGRVYIWDSGEHHSWMRYLLIIGGASFALGHLCAFWYSLVKNGIDFSDIIVGPKSVWGPVLFDIHKKWIVAAMGGYGLATLLAGGVFYGVNYESYLSKKSNKSLWKLIEDVQTALGNEATEMPEISFKKLEGEMNLPVGGDGKLELDGDLSALNPENLEVLAKVLGGDGKSSSSSGKKASFAELAESTDITALRGVDPKGQGRRGVLKALGEGIVAEDFDLSLGITQNSNSDKTPLHKKPLRINQLECFIFGYTKNEAGEMDDLVMGSVVDDEAVFIGLLPSEKIREEHLKGISLDFFLETAVEPIAKCDVDATWLKPTAICVIEHQGKDRKGLFFLNRFVGFRAFL